MRHDRQSEGIRKSHSKLNWILIGFLLVVGYFLVMEHRAHLEGVFNYLPYLLLLACLLLHWFHHDAARRTEPPAANRNQREQQ